MGGEGRALGKGIGERLRNAVARDDGWAVWGF